ncbi:hypothetical protein [Mycobacteroides chelonae]|uniref:hypothetical protein n=1 Tax=Mycobacteroides chelonae TaxID=1774 RepID=UPI0008A8AC1C|nr:hypothetical protein [Mycobacteroides chelonae]OHU29044.1 hypothetical protein BKG78_23530 [Mycobacteroides chelonae]
MMHPDVAATLVEDFAPELAASLRVELGDGYLITTTEEGWTEIHVNPAMALSDELDFVRVLTDDHQFRLLHLSHNEVVCGEATFAGSMLGYLPAVVREFCEAEY